MKGMLKWPLVIAAIVIVIRLVTEQAGVPDSVNNLFSVVALFLLVFPIYFAIQIAKSAPPHPYKTLLKTVALYAALVRLMVLPTYWMAYYFQWPSPRFSLAGGGVVGEGATAFYAFWFPFALLAIWVITSLVIGGGIGSIALALKRRGQPSRQVETAR